MPQTLCQFSHLHRRIHRAQIPFSAFALTSYGELATGQGSHVSLEGQQIRWLGISLLGGNAGIEGPFELGLESIEAVNEEDVSTPPLGK